MMVTAIAMEVAVLYENDEITYDSETGVFTRKVYRGMYPPAASRIRKKPREFSENSNGYLTVSIKSKRLYLHRIAAEFLYGKIPKNKMVDHVNGNRLDNRAANLRLANASENATNSTSYGSSRYRGVHLDKGMWAARLEHMGERHWLGRFPSEEEAHTAYMSLSKRLHGEFRREI